jgi:hypothetical protein
VVVQGMEVVRTRLVLGLNQTRSFEPFSRSFFTDNFDIFEPVQSSDLIVFKDFAGLKRWLKV